MPLVSYDHSDEEDNEIQDEIVTKSFSESLPMSINTNPSSKLLLQSKLVPTVNSVPFVSFATEIQSLSHKHLVPVDLELSQPLNFNPRYEQLFTPVMGPENPFLSKQQKASKNTLTGYMEESGISDFTFEEQRRTFNSYGYAEDPSIVNSGSSGHIVGDRSKYIACGMKTVSESIIKRPGDKRKRLHNFDATDFDGYTGPWAKFADEKTISYPPEEDKAYLEEYLAKKAKNKKKLESAADNEKSSLHIPSAKDYLGRSYLHIPQAAGVNLKNPEPPTRCYVPKAMLHEWPKAHERGVSAIRLFPLSGHLLLSAGNDSKVKLFETYGDRRLLRSYCGHSQAVRDICFNNAGVQFLSASYDRFVKLWDTETGACISRFGGKKLSYCVKFNPDEDKQHLFVMGTADKKIVCYDSRSGEVVQEYDRHMGAVNTITFVDQNRRFISTSDDKSLRVWEWDIPVDFKCITDPAMHSIPSATLSPNGRFLACQSLDSQIIIFDILKGYQKLTKKCFKGHMAAGYACSVDYSPDMKFLISGDGDGKVFAWEWKTAKKLTQWQAHTAACISSLWLPHEPSVIVTASWDGSIKMWQ